MTQVDRLQKKTVKTVSILVFFILTDSPEGMPSENGISYGSL